MPSPVSVNDELTQWWLKWMLGCTASSFQFFILAWSESTTNTDQFDHEPISIETAFSTWYSRTNNKFSNKQQRTTKKNQKGLLSSWSNNKKKKQMVLCANVQKLNSRQKHPKIAFQPSHCPIQSVNLKRAQNPVVNRTNGALKTHF